MEKKINNGRFGIFCCIILSTIILVLVIYIFRLKQDSKQEEFYTGNIYAANYDPTFLEDTPENELIKYGYNLFKFTPQYIGPKNLSNQTGYSGNNLACNNCHLNGGTKPASAPLIGIVQRFPQFRGRENKIGTLKERINGCFERSMNGTVLSENSREMKAYIAYLNWLSRYAPEDGKIEHTGFLTINIPNRKVDLENGQRVFETHCMVCHLKDGSGQKLADSITYLYPPLWGNDSYNNGAGMTRVITAAEFIKGNMPFGTTHDNPILTDEEAYDVAGYINSKERPIKQNLELDFPDIKKKPVSTPYPPYADSFSTEQHQLGPFQPIMEFYKKEFNINKTK